MNLPFVQKRKALRSTSRAILMAAVSVGFAGMAPGVFAQRGGGGHVSSGHVGGGGGGFRPAGNVSGAARGSFGVGSAGRGTSLSRPGTAGPAFAPRTSMRGYSRNYFQAPPLRSGASSTFVGASFRTAAGARPFPASNHIWEAPPGEGRAASTPRAFLTPAGRALGRSNPLASARFTTGPGGTIVRQRLGALRPVEDGTPFLGMTATGFRTSELSALPPFFKSRFHPIGSGSCTLRFGNCGFFNPPFFSSPFFFGFGFNSCLVSGFGCFGLGNVGFGPFGMLDWGYGLGYDYGNGWFYPPAPEPPAPPENPTEENQPPVYAPEYYFVPPPGEPAAAAEQAQQPVVKLVLKDGTIFGVYSYWLQNNQLFYVTTYNIKTSIPVDDLDLQKTVDLNAKLGMKFVLSPKPPDQQQDEPPQLPDGREP